MKVNIEDFFIPQNNVKDNEENQTVVDAIVNSAKAFSRIYSQGLYVIDYATRKFLWFSDNLSVLWGETDEALREMGYDLFLNHVPEPELQMLVEINRAGFEFYDNLPIEKKPDGIIFYSFHFAVGKRSIMVDHSLTPLLLDKDGRIKYALCTFSPSSRKAPGNVVFRLSGTSDLWRYSFEGTRWKKETLEPLSDNEREVIKLSQQGLTMAEIAEAMNYSLDNIKTIKRKLFDRLGAKNLNEAINYIVNYKLM